MRLTTRLRMLEATLRPEDAVPDALIVLEENGVWRDGEGTVIDRATVDPQTQVIRYSLRPDGPK